MCHLMLLMPIIALPIFWLLPPSSAVPIYAVLVAVSGLFYWLIARSMRKRPETGSEGLIGTQAEVVSRLRPLDHAQYLVKSRGELWSANCTDVLQPGDTVNVCALDGIRLLVERLNPHQDDLVPQGKDKPERGK